MHIFTRPTGYYTNIMKSVFKENYDVYKWQDNDMAKGNAIAYQEIVLRVWATIMAFWHEKLISCVYPSFLLWLLRDDAMTSSSFILDFHDKHTPK